MSEMRSIFLFGHFDVRDRKQVTVRPPKARPSPRGHFAALHLFILFCGVVLHLMSRDDLSSFSIIKAQTAAGQMSNFILNINLAPPPMFKPWLLIRQTLQCLAWIFQPAEIILLTDYHTNSISTLLFTAVSIFSRCFDAPSNHT